MDEGLLKFWKNYEEVINWGYRISGLSEENSDEYIVPKKTSTREVNELEINNISNDECDEYDEDTCSSNSSVDIDLEYLQFSKQTLEHQEEVEREKRRVDKEYGLCDSPSSENEFVESIPVEKIDAQKFYGSEGDKIERLENNLQSEFDKFCLMKKPVLWPSLAFNLSVPEPELHLDLKTPNHPFWE